MTTRSIRAIRPPSCLGGARKVAARATAWLAVTLLLAGTALGIGAGLIGSIDPALANPGMSPSSPADDPLPPAPYTPPGGGYEPADRDPLDDDPKEKPPEVEEPKVKQPKVEQPKVEQPKVEQPGESFLPALPPAGENGPTRRPPADPGPVEGFVPPQDNECVITAAPAAFGSPAKPFQFQVAGAGPTECPDAGPADGPTVQATAELTPQGLGILAALVDAELDELSGGNEFSSPEEALRAGGVALAAVAAAAAAAAARAKTPAVAESAAPPPQPRRSDDPLVGALQSAKAAEDAAWENMNKASDSAAADAARAEHDRLRAARLEAEKALRGRPDLVQPEDL